MFPTDLWDNTSLIVCFLFVLSLIELVVLPFGRRETETDQESVLWAFIWPDSKLVNGLCLGIRCSK